MKVKSSMPLIKEHRISKLIESLKFIDKYPYNREKQSEYILKLYPGKTEKSVFRGMIIPTLRYLGLIIGSGKAIRLSSNGKIIVEAEKIGEKEAVRVARIVFLELDKKLFNFIEILKSQIIRKSYFIELISKKLKNITEKQKLERINRWLIILEQSNLITLKDDLIILNDEIYKNAEKELNILPKLFLFKKNVFEEYRSLPLYERGGIIDIPFLRQIVASKFYLKYKMVLTEDKFDKLLTEIPLVTDDYIISLGQPMGAEEKLFHYKDNNYYITLNIRFLKDEKYE